ncbi:protein NRT1/ PTR FAMILY 6.2-like [Chenopodium quinoa]|uniref:protein NRT1/ PTR FAMILY 6.2-like n=1 Tax=Chenopodium quinoa TaxID=63459 RepID=UPI000B776DD4|nr:protein NRT1/ PTR FAMILY 6.2-like [Chenopodium quinoa]
MSSVHAQAFDYNGLPADKSKTGGWIPAGFILGIELCERLSTMGIAVNLVTYLAGTMHMTTSASANIVTDFMRTSFLLCFLGGFLADSFLGRFRTIAISAVIQTIGTGLLALSTRLPNLHPPPCDTANSDKCEPASNFQMGVLYLSLYLIALGTGGLKSSASGFGADQFDESDEKEKANLAYFFNRFFFFISTGTLVAVTVLVYVQEEVSRALAYGICSASMFIAIFALFMGTKRYRYQKSHGSPISHILQVIVAATSKRRMKLPYNTDMLFENFPDASRIHHTTQFSFLDKAAVISEGDHVKNGVLDCNPWKLCSITRVEEVKAVIRLLPIWATTILFWTTYAQILTFSVEQASTMERSIGGFQIPAASLTVFFVLAVLITLGVYDRVVIPLWKKWKGKAGLTNLQRISLGLLLSAVGMAVAAISEMKRRSVAKSTSETSVLPVSVFLLIPQFLLMGAGEAFTYTGQLDFFITESPKGMKGLSTGLFFVTISLGFFVSSFLVIVVQKVTSSFGSGEGWIGDNINKGRLDCFYGLLSFLSLINFGLYLLSAKWYKARLPKPILQLTSGKSSPEEEC